MNNARFKCVYTTREVTKAVQKVTGYRHRYYNDLMARGRRYKFYLQQDEELIRDLQKELPLATVEVGFWTYFDCVVVKVPFAPLFSDEK